MPTATIWFDYQRSGFAGDLGMSRGRGGTGSAVWSPILYHLWKGITDLPLQSPHTLQAFPNSSPPQQDPFSTIRHHPAHGFPLTWKPGHCDTQGSRGLGARCALPVNQSLSQCGPNILRHKVPKWEQGAYQSCPQGVRKCCKNLCSPVGTQSEATVSSVTVRRKEEPPNWNLALLKQETATLASEVGKTGLKGQEVRDTLI